MSDLNFHGRTDIGRRRDHNEDAFAIAPAHNLFLVADGLGGYSAGEIASRLAVDAITGFFDDIRLDPEMTWPAQSDPARTPAENIFNNAVITANQRVRGAAKSPKYHGMSTTVVGMQLVGDRYVLAHVGDSRCYRVRQGRIEQLTEDHSLLAAFRRTTSMTDEEAARWPLRNIVLRAVGTEDKVEVETACGIWQPGDIYLLCSDGLSGELTDEELLQVCLANIDDMDRLTRRLVDGALTMGGRDNITVVAVQIPNDRTRPFHPTRDFGSHTIVGGPTAHAAYAA